MKLNKDNFGYIAEIIIMLRYIFSFHKLLHHRYKSSLGEIDLIFTKGSKIIFVEVKARSNILDDQKFVSDSQKNRLKRSAENFLIKNPYFKEVEFHLAVVSSYFTYRIFKDWLD